MNFEVLKKSHLKRNIIVGVVVVAVIAAIVLNFTRAKYRTAQSMPLINGTVNYSLADLNAVAVYIQDESATDGYAKADTIPTSGYAFNEEMSYCTIDGEEDPSITLSYNMDTQMLTVTPLTTKGTKCYLYFDEASGATDIIEGLYPDNQDMLAYDEAGNLRYIGADPNNYVYFNCSDYTNPSNSTCELWRIIGIFSEDTHGLSGQKLIKLIRNESLGNISWDSANTNDWSKASLQRTLNGDYLNGTGSYASTGIKTSASRDMIETVTWKLGGVAFYTSASNGLASHFYGYERGKRVYSGRPRTWSGKVALMYPSDYGYATSGGSTTNREACLAKELYNWNSSSFSDCKNNDWLYDSSTTQWTLTQGSLVSYYVFAVYRTGLVVDTDGASYSDGVRPSVYLTSNVKISGGDGTANNAYTLEA